MSTLASNSNVSSESYTNDTFSRVLCEAMAHFEQGHHTSFDELIKLRALKD